MATTPSEILINNTVYTRIVNNQNTYLIQNAGTGLISIAASDVDLGATTSSDLGGYKIESLRAIDNSQLKDFAYVYAKSFYDTGVVRV